MKFPDVPDDETLRRIQEFRRLMPSESQQRALEQARQFQELSSFEQQAEQVRQALRVFTAPGSEFYNSMVQIHQNMNEIAKRFVQPAIDSQVVKLIAASKLHEQAKSFYFANSALGAQVAEVMKQMQASVPYEAIVGIRNTLAQMNDGPVRAAMETIRNLNLENAPTIFNEFVEDALEQREPLTKKTVKKVGKSHLSKKKISKLTPDQQFWLMFYAQLLGILIAYFTLIQGQRGYNAPNKPVQINPPQINITNIYQIMFPQIEPINYEVIRNCKLMTHPNTASKLVAKLSSGDKVRLVKANHKWLKVAYEINGVNKEGWVLKKSLTRLSPVAN